MIVTMQATTSAAVSTRLARVREAGGVSALGRVLTLVIVAGSEDVVDRAVRAADGASREHPCRIIVLLPTGASGPAQLDAQIRVGGETGASEVIILQASGDAALEPDTLVIPLLLADAPVVAWWPDSPPASPSTHPVGAMAQRRITDVTASAEPFAGLHRLKDGYAPGDTDLAWSRVTLWRGLLAAALDEPPHEPVTAVRVSGAHERPSVHMLAAWLAERLGVPTEVRAEACEAITMVELERASGTIRLRREPGSSVAMLTRPGRPDQRINLPLRSVEDCLIEELRRLDPDQVYGRALTAGLSALEVPSTLEAP
ncbi:glucose-6-phosphate dehydrogenase assembly protein OpcA [Georgenia faecalis]|uniref:Glucose-6-phosphate dehydrogenase assembly protein OpcA n=1 Tax=Georgenia faecalis TaxID=2483799 RepID=A0ABV9D9L9_9MICO|nr:glucose-6-phosphate dehydrogenase assembly protein OpcA [Georgenia faecalis]